MIKKNYIKKEFVSYVIKFFVSILLVLYLFVAPFTVFKSLLAKQGSLNKNIELSYTGILELWNIDTFEGGSVSRTRWLEKQAIAFEKKHRGTFIIVSSMTVEQSKINLSNGLIPDLISFGIGFGEDIMKDLIPLSNSNNVRDDLLSSAKINGTLYALPYILGGYSLISNNGNQFDSDVIDTTLGFGHKSSNNALISLICNNYTAQKLYEPSKNLDSFSVYDKFINRQFSSLIGTQRDVYRVQGRIEKGALTDAGYKFLGGFSDLIQYIGICSKGGEEQEICKKFMEQILSAESQKSLSDINMFNVLNQKIYSASVYAEMEEELSGSLKTLNVFLANQKLQEIKEFSLRAISGDNEAKRQLLDNLQ